MISLSSYAPSASTTPPGRAPVRGFALFAETIAKSHGPRHRANTETQRATRSSSTSRLQRPYPSFKRK